MTPAAHFTLFLLFCILLVAVRISNRIRHAVDHLRQLRRNSASMLQLKECEQEPSIHMNPDALKWTKYFLATWPQVYPNQPAPDEDWIHGWFANAMMAMHDHLKPNPLIPDTDLRFIPVDSAFGMFTAAGVAMEDLEVIYQAVHDFNAQPVTGEENETSVAYRKVGHRVAAAVFKAMRKVETRNTQFDA